MVWARLCHDYSIQWPTKTPSAPHERRIGLIASLDDRIASSADQRIRPLRVETQPLPAVQYPTAVRVVPGGSYAIVTSPPSRVSIINTSSGLVRTIPVSVREAKLHYAAFEDFGDGEELVLVFNSET